MIMTIKIGAVAGDTFAAVLDGRGDEATIAGRIVAGGTTLTIMYLPATNKRRVGCSMATDTVGRKRACCHIFSD